MTTNKYDLPLALNNSSTLSQNENGTFGGNLPLQQPQGPAVSVVQFNATISATPLHVSEREEPAFGEHIREAAGAAQRLFRR